MAFGVNSTKAQRQAAESLARFSINPLVQRTITLRNLTSLPVNRNMQLPVGASQIVDTMVAAREQGAASERATLPLLHTDAEGADRFRRLITGFLYGEVDARTATDQLVRALTSGSTP
jgi:hypothetical protein